MTMSASYENMSMIDAIRQSLFDGMQQDQRVILAGEDIGVNGGVFRATDGLLDAFGPKRVLDTPLSEALLGGLGVGLAVYGLKPVIEFQFSGFIYPAIDQIVNHAARMRQRTQGRLTAPVVYRAPYSGGIGAPEHHSESPEALFAHVPGLRVVVPSTPARAYGLLSAAIQAEDPIVFLEPKKIYHSQKQTITPHDAWSLDHAIVDRPGQDITLLGWGAMMPMLRTLANTHRSSIDIEVIDLCSIKPIDMETILTSVLKTQRLVVVHEAPRQCGVGADIAAQVSESAWGHLKAPIQRVTGYDCTMPYFLNEAHYLPNPGRIMQAVHHVMEF